MQLSTLHRRFAYARLPQPYLTGSCPVFSATFTTKLLIPAACGGLRSTPDCRSRRANLHLSYSYAPPCGPAVLVTQGPTLPTRAVHESRQLSLMSFVKRCGRN